MQHYVFNTRWFLPAKIDAVWDELAHPERWPNWWQGLVRVQELASGDAIGVGAVKRFVWQGLLPYTLTVDMRVTRKEQPSLLESAAIGELEGLGTWRLSPSAGGTTATYDWRVRTTKPWMNRLGPVARPVFSWNHDMVMRGGLRGLTRWLTGEPK